MPGWKKNIPICLQAEPERGERGAPRAPAALREGRRAGGPGSAAPPGAPAEPMPGHGCSRPAVGRAGGRPRAFHLAPPPRQERGLRGAAPSPGRGTHRAGLRSNFTFLRGAAARADPGRAFTAGARGVSRRGGGKVAPK